VLSAIGLDNQLFRSTDKVHNIGSDNILPMRKKYHSFSSCSVENLRMLRARSVKASIIWKSPHPSWPLRDGQATLSHSLALLVLVEGILEHATFRVNK